MATQHSQDAAEIHPSEIRVGDIIDTLDPPYRRYTVKMISGPQLKRQWTFFGADDTGRQHASTFKEDALVRRYGKAS